MPEVISLISSPLNSPRKQRHGDVGRSPSSSLAKGIFSVGSDDFSFGELPAELDFRTSQPTKKRKLSREDGKTVSGKLGKVQVFAISDDDELPMPCTSTGKDPKETEHQWDGLVSDPVGFSSSAPEPRATNHGKSAILDLSDDLPEDIMAIGDSFSLSQPTMTGKGRTYLSERTVNLLATLNTNPNTLASKSGSINNTKKGTGLSLDVEDIFSSSPMVKPTRRSTRPSKQIDTVKEVRVQEGATARAAKDKQKEDEKEQKRLGKEQKAKEKQEAADIAKVNKSKTDKKVSVSEMIVEMSRSMMGTSVGNQVLEYMNHLAVDTMFSEDEVVPLEGGQAPQSYGNRVHWRRKVRAKYNEDAGYWEPMAQTRIENERHVLVHFTASDFAGLATSRTGSEHHDSTVNEEAMMRNIDHHVANLQRKYKDCMPIYLIEGLESFLRKNQTAKNRAYTAAVLSQLPASDHTAPPASSQARRRKKSKPVPDYSYIDTDVAECLLLHLQLNHSVLIHHTASASETAYWIRTFTEHISTIPYRRERMSLNDAGAAFCMDVGQVKTGDDARDTYVKMLQEVQRVTPAMAYGIVTLYPNVRALVRAFREEGPLVLEDVRKGANRDGALTEGRLGKAVSRRLYKVFMGRNEWSTDGIA